MDNYMIEHVCKPNGKCVYRQSKKIDEDISMFVYIEKNELKKGQVEKCFFCNKESNVD